MATGKRWFAPGSEAGVVVQPARPRVGARNHGLPDRVGLPRLSRHRLRYVGACR
ncbi:hypothetical protein [Nocardioides sp. B-3]|uniref:hypothetical protein n=1 Tax=Nocardioides sp. B-3 TaxID=2895565 RepID=UPI0021535890|nr:hypothetical protein [Nocardioides sp. B-3]UUZ60580.1 hypothetical protein LP418_06855 [Nocardioides sp. B-3]